MLEIYGVSPEATKFADLHMHTNKSDGQMEVRKVVDLAVELGHMNALAITDHDKLSPALEARRYAEIMRYPIEIVPGQEITTSTRGHLLGLFLSEEISTGLSPANSIREVHRQNGIVVAAHPFYKNLGMRSVDGNQIEEILGIDDEDAHVDGVEIFNAGLDSLGTSTANSKAYEWFISNGQGTVAPVGGTDGHFYGVGTGLTGYSGDLREAVLKKETGVYKLERDEIVSMIEKSRKMFGSVVDDRINRLIRRAERGKRVL